MVTIINDNDMFKLDVFTTESIQLEEQVQQKQQDDDNNNNNININNQLIKVFNCVSAYSILFYYSNFYSIRFDCYLHFFFWNEKKKRKLFLCYWMRHHYSTTAAAAVPMRLYNYDFN